MELSADLREKAIECDICQRWRDKWGAPDKDVLIMRYKRGIAWCMGLNYPTPEYCVENFGIEKLEEYSIYVDKEATSENEPTLVIRGNSDFDITYDYYNVGAVWIGNDSKAIIRVKENAIVNVFIFDNALVEVVCDDSAKVNVYRDGEKEN